MAVLMAIGMTATLMAIEPARREPSGRRRAARLLEHPRFRRRRRSDRSSSSSAPTARLALLMLAMISLYRLPEYMMGPMANPYYHDLGLSKDTVGAVRASIGLVVRCSASPPAA